LATDLAILSDAELLIFHVVPYQAMPEGLREFAKAEGLSVEEEKARYHASKSIGDEITSQAEARVRKNGLAKVATQVAEGSPSNRIVAVARSEGADMIFLGSRGLGEVMGVLMGSVSHKVMNLAPCTCVAVR